ncbi:MULTISPECIES: DUF4142 domain-containing protein [Burkholderia]|uniref:DUF4142 domain-containing protein n=1 Tax=Burkholderia TaxID=32008 RepID=UPI000DAD0264|nr:MULTISPECIES: DUF4142 domain-containing protein [Burkholderia]MDP9543652.1 putative membrane protein [Burkholderia cepacia]MBR8096702.1 DUF4142 domain-containing protein [Burkholderia cenocepacia]MBR8388244.1 DUF4142 domain-containing protein [Burkholderia cenocepacia]MBR8466810.1 DUF4142 domain-containing protein [Burkholderia cenocepacia]MBR8492459.1 DUF4142 domain-containing protein [Burkholderia cenocepacia]
MTTLHRMKPGTRRPMAIVLTAAVSILTSALSHAQAPPASSAQVAPGVIRPGPTADEPGLTQRPIGIDAEFVDKAGMIGKVERQAGQLALDRSSNADVKAFARRMVDDHARIADELRHIGAQKGVPVQTRMLVDPEVTALRAKDGRAFDAAYVALAGPRAHEAAVRLYETEAKEGRDPQLRAFAARTLPTLNAHLSAARQLAKTVAAAQ